MEPVITAENLNRAALDDWVKEFGFIYHRQDAKRSPMGIWFQVVQHSSKLAESIRLEEYNECLDHLARCYCWLCSFVARCQQVSDDSPYRAFQLTRLLSEIVFEKYPNLCPACGEKPCKCPADRYNAEHRSPAYKQAVLLRLQQKDPWRNEINPVELERFVGMFGGIYGGAHYGLPLETIGFHFLEEIGEVANAIRLIHEAPEGELEEHLKLLRNEIADVLSWICSLVLKLRQYVGTGFSYVKRYMPDIRHTPDVRTSVTLSRIVWDFYAADSEFLRCNSCKARPCTEEMLDKTM